MARPGLGVKREKWPYAIKMKPEKVLPLSLAISFFFFPTCPPPTPVGLCLSITHFDPLPRVSLQFARTPSAQRHAKATTPPCVARRLVLQKPEDTTGSWTMVCSGAADEIVRIIRASPEIWLNEGVQATEPTPSRLRPRKTAQRSHHLWGIVISRPQKQKVAMVDITHMLMLMAAQCLQVGLQQKGLIYSPRDTTLVVPS